MGRQSFNGFKKVGSTATHTTFAHPNGSRLTIPHAALDKKTLQKMSGIKKYSGEDSEENPKSQVVETPATAPMENIALPKDQPDVPFAQRVGHFIGNTGVPILRQAVKDATAPERAAWNALQDFGSGFSQGVDGADASAAPATEQSGPAPTNVSLAAAPQTQGAGGGGNPYAEMYTGQNPSFKYDPYQGINTQIAGAQNEANAIGRIEDEKARLIQEHQKSQEALNYQIQQNAWNNKVETDNWIEDMKSGHIDPKAYVNNMTTGQKTATAIGLILGGMSEGLLHNGKNPALEMLNKNIDNDIKAQLENRENKKTIFNAMQKQYGNQQDALTMLRAFYTQKLVNDMGEAAARNGSDLAKARAAQVIGPLQQQLQQAHFDVGMRQAALQNMASGNVANMAAAIPYLVRDKTKVSEAAKAYGEAMQLNHQQDNLVKSFNDIRGKFRNGLLSPNDTQSAKQAFIGNMQVALEHRYNAEAAAALGNAIFPRATDSDATVENKFKRLLQETEGARSEKDATLRALTGGLLGAPRSSSIFNNKRK
jgi:hypothetical protein